MDSTNKRQGSIKTAQLTRQFLSVRGDSVEVGKVTREVNWIEIELIEFCVHGETGRKGERERERERERE